MFHDRQGSDNNLKHRSMYALRIFTDLAFDEFHKVRIFLDQPIPEDAKVLPPSFSRIDMVDRIHGFTGNNWQSYVCFVFLFLVSCHRLIAGDWPIVSKRTDKCNIRNWSVPNGAFTTPLCRTGL